LFFPTIFHLRYWLIGRALRASAEGAIIKTDIYAFYLSTRERSEQSDLNNSRAKKKGVLIQLF
jgi:hypothetical protein